MVKTTDGLEVLLTAETVVARVEALAARLAPRLGGEAVGLCLLLGGLWFAADLSRALSRHGKQLAFDALWLSSYGEGQASAGRCQVLAGPQRSLAGRQVLIMDDVVDTGVSLAEACRLVRASGAGEVLTAVFARKPWPTPRAIEPDDFAWDAPARFLVGYGMDVGGRYRDLPYVAAAE
ncbi:MAG TPA: phosphoribosyltransferase family protein [Caulobacteraceae bacterium]|jgi:hypoxanthine phosphoribosyltransferase